MNPKSATISLVVVWLNLAAASAQTPAMFNDSQSIDLLFSGVLDRELELTKEQIAALKRAAANRRADMRARFDVPKDKAKGNGQTVQNALLEATRTANENSLADIGEILLISQRKRWQQIALQLTFRDEPTRALLLPRITEEIGVNATQKRAIRKAFQDATTATEEYAIEVEKARDEALLEILTKEQRDKYHALFGKPFRKESPPATNTRQKKDLR